MALQLRKGHTSSFGKMIATSFAVLALVAQPLVALNVPSAFALGGNVSVCAAGCDSTTIQGGIDMASAGGTVTVSAGKYNEDISITKNIILSGAGSSTTTLNGQGTVDYAINITGGAAGGTSISGFHIVAAVGKVGLKVDKTGIDQFGVTNNIFSGGRQLVYVGGTTNSTFTGNTFNVAGNTVASVYEAGEPSNGTGAVNPTANTWSGNTFVGSTTQLAFGSEASNSAFTNNNLTGLNVSIKDKIVEYSGTNNTGSGNTFNSAQPAISVYDDGTDYKGTFATMDKALSKVTDGDSIDLETNLVAHAEILLNKHHLTFNGNGHIITADYNFNGNSANNSIIEISGANDVTIKQVVVDGQGTSGLHGVNVYQSSTTTIWDVTTRNNSKSGINVNGSQVVAGNLYTSGNGWNGIDVDKPGAWLKVAGINHFNESGNVPAIYVDVWSPSKIQIDNPQLYAHIDNYKAPKDPGNRAFFPISAVPALPDNFYFNNGNLNTTDRTLVDGSVTNSTLSSSNSAFPWVHWDAQSHTSYHIETYFKKSDGSWKQLHITNNSKPTPYRFYGFGSEGDGLYRFKVVAYNTQNGLKSAPVNVTLSYDTTAPVVTVNSPANGSLHNTDVAVVASIADANLSHRYLTITRNGNPYNIPGVTGTSIYSGEFSNQTLATLTQDGNYVVKLEARDKAGNKTSASVKTVSFTIDKTAPSVPTALLFDANNNGVTNGYINTEHFTFNLGSSSDTTRYQLKYWNDIAGSSFKVGSPWNPTNLSGYSSSLGVYNDQFTQGEGVHYFAFSACDAAGNCSAYGSPFTVTYDKTAPPAPTADFTPNADGTQKVELEDTEAGVSIYYTTDGTTPTTSSNSYNGAFSVTPVVAPAVLTIKAIAVDAAGNVSSVYTVAGPSITNQASQTATTNAITLVWTTGTPATSRVVYDTVPHATLGNDANYGYAFSTAENTTKTTNHSVTITGLTPRTTYYFRVVSHGSPTTVSPEITSLTLDEQKTQATGTPTFRVNTPQANPVVAVAQTGDQSVLGDETTTGNNTQNTPSADNTNDDKDVKGAEDVKNSDTTSPLGVAWYWWVLALAAVATGIWWLIAARKRRKDEDK